MVRRSLSNPLLSIRPFTAAWRRKNSAFEKAGGKQDRKTSIDQTILSGDESRLNASPDFSPSFDIDSGTVEVFPPNFSHGFVAEEHCDDTAPSMKPSLSDPSFLSHHPDAGLCPCQDCSPYYSMAQDEQLRYSTCFYPFGAPLMPPLEPQRPTSPSSNNPALQARIEAVRIQQQLLGENHPDVIFALSSLAKLHQKRGNHVEAASILKESQMRSMLANSTPQHSASSRQKPQEETTVPTEISFSHLS
eukprot:CAMPEP_0172326838 /NCGR_PEP_ID=MMETSP1058-20130122/57720_1 /TAXON_ID=83371 /ORGANISM="Detonula confervacea, Strain CCMP 353" /LENGTH=246 /DNA_ID=CAMNT_0013043725 /DNA_START=137 /DNA_END=877 /DNA_ORIENTATION=+